ncbi:unnamed protein product [Didymodactylos carnosus]|uniref:Uncharacterized protein n=1 Tax=Didymodactylos carnosus TaxID=1234261 RepID=A0A814JB18_9BILA|nr:unnamed protein product [Didymodactylos carnosus]CAF1033190.1 unnamed protein product [Didymodactylos carnosus]CAF3598345.1 unnamed protein product [Didymodactylos carnosus]CAF3803927.1 unnamed protein product [Didymodactylos carnosus]
MIDTGTIAEIMNFRKLRTPARSHIRPPIIRVSTPKIQAFLPPTSLSSQSEHQQQLQQSPLFDQDENDITLCKLYSNLLLLGMEYNQEYYQKHWAYIGNLRQFSIDNLLQSQELVRLVTHFLIVSYELSLTRAQTGEKSYVSDYLRGIPYYFPPIGEKLTEYNRLVKNKFQQISTLNCGYPWPKIIPDPSCVHRFYLCLFYLSQLCLIKRLPKNSQIRFKEMNCLPASNQSINVGNNEKNGSITKDRLQRVSHLIKCDTSRNYQMFYKKIADDYEKRNKFFQLKEQLEQELEKLIYQYERANLYSQQFTQQQQQGSLIEKVSNSSSTSPLYSNFTELFSSTNISPFITTFEICQAAIVCLRERFHTYEENGKNSKLCAQIIEQISLTVKQIENIQNLLTHFEQQKQHLCSIVPTIDENITTNYVNDIVENGDTIGYSQINTSLITDHDLNQCGHEGRIQLANQLYQRPLNVVRNPSSTFSFLNDSSSLTCIESVTTTIQGAPRTYEEETMSSTSSDLSFRQLEALLLGPNRTKTTINDDSFIRLENQLNNEEENVDDEIDQHLTISPQSLSNDALTTSTTLNNSSSVENDMSLSRSSEEIIIVSVQDQYNNEKENIFTPPENIVQIPIEIKASKLISPILSSPLRARPELPKLLTQIESIDPY